MEIYYNLFDENEDEKLKSKELLKKAFSLKGYDFDKLDIQTTKHGRPFCKLLDFDFNISHSCGMTCVAFGKKVGIDCQKITEVKESVINRVCSESEIENLKNSKNKKEEFIRLWTFKEAFTKMIGSGFKYGFKNATVENSFCLYEDIKIFQKIINNFAITAVEDKGNKIEITQIQ